MGIGERIKFLRLKQDLTQEQLGDLIGVSKSAIANYENHGRGINSDKIVRLCKVFNVEPNYLFQDSFSAEEFFLSTTEKDFLKLYKSLDIYGRKSTLDHMGDESLRIKETQNNIRLIFRYHYLDLKDYYEQNVDDALECGLPDAHEFRIASAIVNMNDNSMEPKFFRGDLLLMERCDKIGFGETGLFKVGDQFVIRDNEVNRLQAVNKECKSIDYDEKVLCLGRVIRKI